MVDFLSGWYLGLSLGFIWGFALLLILPEPPQQPAEGVLDEDL